MQRVAFQYIMIFFCFMVLSCFSPEHVQKHLCKHGFLTKTRPFSTQHSGENVEINKIIVLLWTNFSCFIYLLYFNLCGPGQWWWVGGISSAFLPCRKAEYCFFVRV